MAAPLAGLISETKIKSEKANGIYFHGISPSVQREKKPFISSLIKLSFGTDCLTH
jgi:hypothetical protein